MLPYWLLFAFFATGAALARPRDPGNRRYHPFLLIGALAIALMIGFRYEIGGDWVPYQQIFARAASDDLGRVLALGDPGYQLLNWLVQQFDGDIWVVNLVGGLIFSWGLFSFAVAQRSPWLTIVVAIPYLVIVVAMGYSRQAIAIGILMAGLAAHLRGDSSILKFGLYVVLAALFHRTAIVAFPLVALAAQRTPFLNILATLAGAVFLYDVFLADEMNAFVRNYLVQRYSSEGAAIRVVMSLIPATLFLASGRKFGFREEERLIWRNFSIATWILLLLLLVLPSSTVVDRIALYIIPLQLAVLARVPDVYFARQFGVALVIVYSFLIQFTWLNYASHARYWVPYSFYPV